MEWPKTFNELTRIKKSHYNNHDISTLLYQNVCRAHCSIGHLSITTCTSYIQSSQSCTCRINVAWIWVSLMMCRFYPCIRTLTLGTLCSSSFVSLFNTETFQPYGHQQILFHILGGQNLDLEGEWLPTTPWTQAWFCLLNRGDHTPPAE